MYSVTVAIATSMILLHHQNMGGVVKSLLTDLNLTYLSISNTDIDVEAIHILKFMKSLRYLYLSYPIPKINVKKLEKLLPNCYISAHK